MPSLRALLLAFAAAVAPAMAAAEPAADAGRLLLDLRLRYETFDPGAADAEALTARLRLRWEAPVSADLTGLVEIEAIGALVDNYADGVRPRPGAAVIPDPEIVELNRAQLTWRPSPQVEAVLGRQRIVLNNARFVGNVGWRQNEQTFDAAKLVWRPADPVSVTYAYVEAVRRPVGRDHPQGVWEGETHLAQFELQAGAAGKLSAYGYLIDLKNAPAQSSATAGVRLTGDRPLADGLSATWELEYARQTDWGNSPHPFDLDYGLVSAGLKGRTFQATVVWERLGGDGRRGFQTPLATLHAFQGWSDVIGATPAFGLRDLYLRGSREFAAARPIRLSGEVHEFRAAERDLRLGTEVDAAVSVRLSTALSMEAGVARFDADAAVYPHATRGWLSLEYRR